MVETCRDAENSFKMVSRLFNGVILALLIFAPRINLYGSEISVYQVISFIGLLYGATLPFRPSSDRKESYRFVALWLLASIYSLAITLFTGYYDSEMLSNIVYGAALYFFALLLRDYYRRQQRFLISDLLGHVYTAGVIHAIVMALQFNFESVSMLSRILFIHSEKGILFLDTNTRATGLTSGGGSALSAINACMIILGFYWKETWIKFSFTRDSIFWACQGLLIYATFVSGRAGLFLGLIAITYYLLLRAVNFLAAISINVVRKKDLWLPVMVLLFVSLLFIGIQHLEQNQRSWLFELFYSASETGEFRTKSTDIIFGDMLFLPEGVDLLVGTGNAGRADETSYLATDIGYIRLIYFCGIVGLSLWLLPFVSLLIEPRAPKKISSLAPVLLVIQSVMMAKELFFVLSQGWTLFFFLICVSLRGTKRHVTP